MLYTVLLFVIFYISVDLIQGQTYNLTGSSLYGIKGGDFSFTCQLPDGAKIPYLLVFRKDLKHYCSVDPDNCRSSSQRGSRYSCGCNNKRLYYMNISSLTSSDEGNWNCLARIYLYTEVKSKTVSLPVYYGPDNITFSPQTVEVVENSSREIDCQSDCNPTCTITWYTGSDTTGTIVPSTNGHLKLNNIKREDTTYTCQAQHTVLPSRTKTLQITVFYGPDNIDIGPPRTTVVENSTINITCSSDCNPSCIVNWYKDSTLILSNNRVVSLPNIKRQQDGNYTCHVTNSRIPGSTKTKLVPITVNYLPIISSIKLDSTNNIEDEGSRVVFSCSVDSRPSSIVTWSRSGEGQLSSTEQYILPKATCQHTDNYTCTAYNNIGTSVSRSIPLYVRCIPRVDQSKDMKNIVFVSPGASTELEVHVLAWPIPVFTWYRKLRDGSEELATDFRMKQKDAGLTSTLTIEDVGEDDLGKYVVYVNNSLGTRSTLFNLLLTAEETNGYNFRTSIVIGITSAVVGVILTSIICIFLHRSGKLIYNADGKGKYQKEEGQHRGSDNLALSDVSPVVYDRVDSPHRHFANRASSSSLKYEGLDEQTREHVSNTYHQLNLYQNQHVTSN